MNEISTHFTRNVNISILLGKIDIYTVNFSHVFCFLFSDEDPSSMPLASSTHLTAPESSHHISSNTPLALQNRYQNVSQNGTSTLLPTNLLGGSLGPIGQPYSAEICNYGPVYHPHNILHNYNPVYSNDKSVRGGNFARGVYGNYSGFYGNNPNLRTGSYDFTPR